MLVERTDLRRYDNGRYTGLVSREVRSFIAQSSSPEYAAPGDTYYDGSFYIMEATKRNSHDVKMGINESIPSSFRITSDGELHQTDRGKFRGREGSGTSEDESRTL